MADRTLLVIAQRVQEILSWLETEYADGTFDVRNRARARPVGTSQTLVRSERITG